MRLGDDRVLISRSLVLMSAAAATLWAVGCATDGSGGASDRSRSSSSSGGTTSKRQLDDAYATLARCQELLAATPYVDALTERIVDSVSDDLIAPYDETAILRLTLGIDGYVDRMELRSVSSPTVESAFQMLVDAPPDLPRAPRDVRACLGSTPFPFFVKVMKRYVCEEQTEFIAYYEDLHLAIYEVLYRPHFAKSPGRGWVRIDLTIGSEGEIREIDFRGRPTSLASEKLGVAIRRLEPFPAPPEFSRCFAEKPIAIRVEVQGS